MKACFSILVFVALSAPLFTAAQDEASHDLNTLLRDASYVFNRFEEVSAGARTQIDSYPVEIRKSSKGALSGVLRNREGEKPALNALLRHSEVSSADLLDVYTELVEVASELDNESTNNVNWGDPKLGTDLAH
jgi:hypothetical protein